MPERYQVVIVGGGPVGVALAVDLTPADGWPGLHECLASRFTTLQRRAEVVSHVPSGSERLQGQDVGPIMVPFAVGLDRVVMAE